MSDKHWWERSEGKSRQDDSNVESALWREFLRAVNDPFFSALHDKAGGGPRVRFVYTEDGRRVPAYRCRVCKDGGLVSLPVYHDGETDEELTAPVFIGAGEAHFCPACREKASEYRVGASRFEIEMGTGKKTQAEINRIDRWLEARKERLKKFAEGASASSAQVFRLAQTVGATMPGGDDGQ